MTYEIDTIPLEAVRINGGTQSRVALSETTIAEYAETIRSGADLPPVVAFFDGVNFWLADGFHRYFAHKTAGAMEISAEIREGTNRDAVLYSVGANASHGLRRTNEDKRRAVMTLLNDPEWAAWSDREVSRACSVSHTFVQTLRPHLATLPDSAPPATRIVERNGTTYEQNTANIGKSTAAAPAARPQASPAPILVETSTSHEVPPAAPLVTGAPEESDPPPAAIGELEALREQVAELSDALKSTLADNEMMGRVFDADDQIKAAMDEAKRQKAIADNAERTLASKSGEFIERARAVTHWKNRAEKAEKALAKLENAK